MSPSKGALLTWFLIGLVRVGFTNYADRLVKIGVASRVWRVVYDIGHVVAVGLVIGAGMWGWSRLELRWPRTRTKSLRVAGIAVVALALAFPMFSQDLNDFATGLAEDWKVPGPWLHAGLVLATGASIPLMALVVMFASDAAARRRSPKWLTAGQLRWALLLPFAALTVGNHFALTVHYPGAHLLIALHGGIFGLGAFIRRAVPAPEAVNPSSRTVLLRFWLIQAPAIMLAAFSLVVPPSNRVRLLLLEEQGNNIAPFWLMYRVRDSVELPADVSPALKAWYRDRELHPPVPKTRLDSFDEATRKNQIVILFTMDSVRSDVFDGKYDKKLPTFARLKREGVHFTQARVPGTGTCFTLTALFASKYFSQMYWTKMPKEDSTYPWDDPSARFPAVLTEAGVQTVAFGSRKFMLEQYGIARGFAENTFIKPLVPKTKANTGRQLGEGSQARLNEHDGGPLFMWIHNMDPHAPFNAAGKQGTAFERYVREVALADSELGQLREIIEAKGWADRTTYIVSSDHGEGFGEHGTRGHSTNMYEELLRVPLVISGPMAKAIVSDEMVSSVDIGPTVLDIFDLDTPGSYMGQTLLPLMQGRPSNLTRPIVAETRLKQAMVFPDGIKVIRDQRLGTQEIYDLNSDPKELSNLFEDPSVDSDRLMSYLGAFFSVHTLKRPGYTPPYRTW